MRYPNLNITLNHFHEHFYVEANGFEDRKNLGRILELMCNTNLMSPYSNDRKIKTYIQSQLKGYYDQKNEKFSYSKKAYEKHKTFYLRFSISLEENKLKFLGCANQTYEYQLSWDHHHLIESPKKLLLYLSKHLDTLATR